MYRLILLFAGAALAVYGFRLIANAENAAPYVVRDGLIVAFSGAILFLTQTISLPALAAPRRIYGWQPTGRLVFFAALPVSVVAALLLVGGERSGLAGLFGLILWLSALLLSLAGIAWPGGEAHYRRPSYRWSVDAAGRIVRTALGSGTDGDETGHNQVFGGDPLQTPSHWGFYIAGLAVLVAGALLRLWQVGTLPPECVAAECAQALALMEGGSDLTVWRSGIQGILASGIFRFNGDALLSLRLASALLGLALLPVLYWAARPYARAGGAGLATVILALAPWHIWASRLSAPWMAVPLWTAVALWAATRGLAGHDKRWWYTGGVAAGLLLWDAPALWPVVLLWLLVLGGVLVIGQRSYHASWGDLLAQAAVPLVGAAVIALPVLAVAAAALQEPVAASAAELRPDWFVRLAALLYGGASPGFFLDQPLLAPAVAGMAIAGLVTLAGNGRRPRTLLVTGGFVLFLWPLFWLESGRGSADPLLILSPFLYIGTAAALDQLVAVFQQTWRPLIVPERVLAGALVLLLLLATPRTWQLVRGLDTVQNSAQTTADNAIGRYLAQCLDTGGEMCVFSAEDPTTAVYVPARVLANPATRLIVGPALDSGQIRALQVAHDLLPPPALPGDLVYLVPIEEHAVLAVLQQFYPDGQYFAMPLDDGPTSFVVYHVPREKIARRRGLQGFYYAGPAVLQQEEAIQLARTDSLAFGWAQVPPLDAPFSVHWEGSLIAPVSGPYEFELVVEPGPEGDLPVISMQLDGQLILDSSLGVTQKREMLVQGVYDVDLYYRTDGPPGNWSIRWRRPDGEAEPIPQAWLISPALPNIGLVGTYYAGDQLQGPAVAVRKDPVIGADVDLPLPYSVRWEGKLAASRAGEYVFALTADGYAQLLVDGQAILQYRPPNDQDGSPYAQASVYLTQGWHPIELQYVPSSATPEIRLLWQPPGSSPSLLFGRSLLPILAPVHAGDVDLPAPPDLLDARLGDDTFALSGPMDLYQPSTTFPPSGLARLTPELVWQTAAVCGAGEDQLNAPHGVVIDGPGDRIYVADTANRRIVAYSLAGGPPVAEFSDAAFEEPVDLALAPDGRLAVLDALAQQIFWLDPATGLVTPQPLGTGFYRPRGIDVDPDGLLLVADTGGGRVAVLDPNGNQIGQHGGIGTLLGQGQPVDALAGVGNTWAITAEDGRLWHLATLGSLVVIPRANTVDGPHLAGLPDGTFFLTDPVRQTVLYVSRQGQPLAQFAYAGTLVLPTGVGAALVDDLVYLALADTAACTLSVWRTPAELLP